MEKLADMSETDDYDFSGEFEGRMLTRIAVLDRMIVDADREILRLQELLAESKGATTGLRDQSVFKTPVSTDAPIIGAGPSATTGRALSHCEQRPRIRRERREGGHSRLPRVSTAVHPDGSSIGSASAIAISAPCGSAVPSSRSIPSA